MHQVKHEHTLHSISSIQANADGKH